MIEDLLVLAPKTGPLERMRLNAGQELVLDFVAERWGNDLPLVALIPKARQLGVSTFVQALLFVLCLVHEKGGQPYRVATIAHLESSAKSIFTMTRLFEKKLPASWRLPIESNQQGRIEWAGGSRNQVVSAKLGDQALKGETLNAFHGSEVANWADLGQDPNELWTSAEGCIAYGPYDVVIFESTAKGRDPFFHGKIDRALRGESNEPILFLPWYLEPRYAISWERYKAERPMWDLPAQFEPTLEEIAYREFLSQRLVRPGAEWHVYRVDLTDEQLIWRRSKIEKYATTSSWSEAVERFRRYYPSTVEECFSATEHSFISDQRVLDRLWSSWREPSARGDVHEPGMLWKPSPVGYLTRWHAPERGRHYVIGADVSEGLAAGDFQAAYVIDKATLEVVAAIHTKCDPEDYAATLARVGRYYNDALIAVENNFSPTVVAGLRKAPLNYPNVYWHRDADQVRGRPAKPGFNTNKRTRKVILDTLRMVLTRDQIKFNDRGLVTELGTFVHSEREGSFKATKGNHDDRIMALAIAVYVAGRRPDDGVAAAAAEVGETTSPGYEAWQRNKRRVAERKRYARVNGDTTTGGGCPL